MATRKTNAASKTATKNTTTEQPKFDTTISEKAEEKVTAPIQHKTVEKSFSYQDIDTRETVIVRNGVHGILVYESPRTHEVFKWSEFGDEQEMEIQELRTAKNNYKQFFTENWFMFDDDYAWIVDYLGVGAYYKHTLNIDRLFELFDMSDSDMQKEVSALTNGQKLSIAYIAREMIADGRIDSRKKVEALEAALGMSLSEE